MKSPLRLAKIRLINWHNFVDETISVEGSLFLIGDNGSGKTTLLDAVHCALTGDWKVELNAAARVGGRGGQGRNLQGIALGQDLELGMRRPDGAVAYAALEFRAPGENGNAPRQAPLSIGMGVYVASRDARPEKWGFIKSAPLEEIPLTVATKERPAARPGAPSEAEPDPSSEGRRDASTGGRPILGRRPADRNELLAALGQGNVFDIGRYRTRVGERLFGSRSRLEQVATFLHAGKAYRELVGKTANFSDLIAELLPQPDIETFHEVRRALEAIERTRTDLDGLEQELARLRELLFGLEEVARTREAIARYDYLAAEHAHDEARRDVDDLEVKHARAAEALSAATRARKEGEARLAGIETDLERLRSSGAMEIVERHREVRRLHERQRAAAQQLESLVAGLTEEADRVRMERAELIDRLQVWGGEAAQTIEDALAQVRAVAPEAEIPDAEPLRRPLREVAESAATTDLVPAELDGSRRRLRRDLDGLAAQSRERRRAARREAAAALRERRVAERSIRALREQGEGAPPVDGLAEAMARLSEAGIGAVPLYRLLEPREGIDLAEAGVIERALGRRLLGTLIVPADEHARALSLLLENAPGIAVADPQGARAEIEAALSQGEERAEDRSVFDLLEVTGRDPAAEAFVRHHAAGLRWVPRSSDPEGRAPGKGFLTADGHLSHARSQMRVGGGPAVWLGEGARRHAFEAALKRFAAEAESAQVRADAFRTLADERLRDARALEEAAAVFDRLDLIGIASLVNRRDELARMLGRLEGETTRRKAEAGEAAREATALARDLETLAVTMREKGLEALSSRIQELDCQRADQRRELDRLGEELGRRRERLTQLDERGQDARDHRETCGRALGAARDVLAGLVPDEHRVNLPDYIMNVRRGRQIKAANLPGLREEALRRSAILHERITQSEGVRHPLLWQKYAFHYGEEDNVLLDSSGKSIDEITERLQAQVDELNEALRGRNEELLERIVLQELAGVLRREVDHLRSTVQGINHLMGDLVFGRTRYRIEPRLKPEMSRLHTLLKESSRLSPGAREELRDYFAARLEEFGEAGTDTLPIFLDYRLWFDFHLRMSTLDDDGVELSQERMRQGSGGEQAVPAYLLLFCLTKLLYDGIDARVRLLIIDEAFYGIDGGRRDELLRFCGRAGIGLVVATPEVDGVTEALPSSTTLLIEKTPEADVFLFDLHYHQRKPTLFEPEAERVPEDLVLGAPREDDPS